MKVLLTGAGGAGIPLWDFGLGNKYELHYADADSAVFRPDMPRDRCHVIPRAGSLDFERVVRNLGMDLIIPGVDEELGPLEALRRQGQDVLMPGQWHVITSLDKLSLMNVLRERGIPVPDTWIEKPRWGRGSRDLRILQQRLEGQEYTVQLFASKLTHLRAIVPMRVDCKRGITIRGVLERNPEVIAACEHIHDVFPLAGVSNIQGILTRDGFKPFEINPRVSTTTGVAIAAGIDPIAIWYEWIEPIPGEFTMWRDGIRLARYWANVLT